MVCFLSAWNFVVVYSFVISNFFIYFFCEFFFCFVFIVVVVVIVVSPVIFGVKIISGNVVLVSRIVCVKECDKRFMIK